LLVVELGNATVLRMKHAKRGGTKKLGRKISAVSSGTAERKRGRGVSPRRPSP
jgi:hypothetical protein